MELNALISAADIGCALQNYLGADSNNSPTRVNFTTSKATEKVQGFLSVILRVKVTYGEDGEQNHVNFIVKRTPVSELQLQYTRGSDFYQRESDFFNKAQPLLLQNLREKSSILPIVRCYFASDTVVILEDLSASGHRIVSMPPDGRNFCSLELPHIALVVRKTAILHAASMLAPPSDDDRGWLSVLPRLAQDGLFEGHGTNLMGPRIKNGSLFISEVLKNEFPQEDPKYHQWLESDACYAEIVRFVKPSSKFRNVLCHGDIWENNVMFLFNEDDTLPRDLKFIDLQLVRFSPASIDLQFFLYLGTDKPFRDANETSLLSAYVEEFNEHLQNDEGTLTLDELIEEYDACRLFGAILAATIRPACFLEGWVAENDGEVNQEVVSTFIDGLPVHTLMQSFNEDQFFRKAVLLLVQELLEQLKINGI